MQSIAHKIADALKEKGIKAEVKTLNNEKDLEEFKRMVDSKDLTEEDLKKEAKEKLGEDIANEIESFVDEISKKIILNKLKEDVSKLKDSDVMITIQTTEKKGNSTLKPLNIEFEGEPLMVAVALARFIMGLEKKKVIPVGLIEMLKNEVLEESEVKENA